MSKDRARDIARDGMLRKLKKGENAELFSVYCSLGNSSKKRFLSDYLDNGRDVGKMKATKYFAEKVTNKSRSEESFLRISQLEQELGSAESAQLWAEAMKKSGETGFCAVTGEPVYKYRKEATQSSYAKELSVITKTATDVVSCPKTARSFLVAPETTRPRGRATLQTVDLLAFFLCVARRMPARSSYRTTPTTCETGVAACCLRRETAHRTNKRR